MPQDASAREAAKPLPSVEVNLKALEKLRGKPVASVPTSPAAPAPVAEKRNVPAEQPKAQEVMPVAPKPSPNVLNPVAPPKTDALTPLPASMMKKEAAPAAPLVPVTPVQPIPRLEPLPSSMVAPTASVPAAPNAHAREAEFIPAPLPDVPAEKPVVDEAPVTPRFKMVSEEASPSPETSRKAAPMLIQVPTPKPALPPTVIERMKKIEQASEPKKLGVIRDVKSIKNPVDEKAKRLAEEAAKKAAENLEQKTEQAPFAKAMKEAKDIDAVHQKEAAPVAKVDSGMLPPATYDPKASEVKPESAPQSLPGPDKANPPPMPANTKPPALPALPTPSAAAPNKPAMPAAAVAMPVNEKMPPAELPPVAPTAAAKPEKAAIALPKTEIAPLPKLDITSKTTAAAPLPNQSVTTKKQENMPKLPTKIEKPAKTEKPAKAETKKDAKAKAEKAIKKEPPKVIRIAPEIKEVVAPPLAASLPTLPTEPKADAAALPAPAPLAAEKSPQIGNNAPSPMAPSAVPALPKLPTLDKVQPAPAPMPAPPPVSAPVIPAPPPVMAPALSAPVAPAPLAPAPATAAPTALPPLPALPAPAVKSDLPALPAVVGVAASAPPALPLPAVTPPAADKPAAAKAGGEAKQAASIQFKKGNAMLTAEDKAALSDVAEKVKKSQGTVRIVGYASGTVEERSIARRTSNARAGAIRGYLIEKGVNEPSISAQALGNQVNEDRADVFVK